MNAKRVARTIALVITSIIGIELLFFGALVAMDAIGKLAARCF